MPHRPIPEPPEPSVSFSAEGLRTLLKEREEFLPLSPWETELYNTLESWVLHGVPADYGPLKPAQGKHRLSEQELKLTYDKLARFIDSKFRPLLPRD